MAASNGSACAIPRYAEPDAPTYAEHAEQKRREAEIAVAEQAMKWAGQIDRESMDLLAWSVDERDDVGPEDFHDVLVASLLVEVDQPADHAAEAFEELAFRLSGVVKLLQNAAEKAREAA